MKPTNKRQEEHHNKMIEAGFKKRSFYLNSESMEKLNKYRVDHGLNNLHEAINKLCRDS